MSPKLAPLVAVLALAAAPVARAQAPQIAYGEPHPHQYQAELASDAAARAAGVARQETGDSPITMELYRLSGLLRRAEHHTSYGHGRGRGIHRRIQAQLGAVEDAFAQYPGRPSRMLRHAMRRLEGSLAQYGYGMDRQPPAPPPYPTQQPYPYPSEPSRPQYGFRFEGAFAGMPVVFEGPSADALFEQCRAQLARSRFGGASDISIFGVRERKVASYWAPDALCAIVALNARPVGMHVATAPVEGRVESVPFRVFVSPSASSDALLRRFLPLALRNDDIDEIVVNGRPMHAGGGCWSVDEAVQIVLSYSRGYPYAAGARSAVYVR